MIEDETLMKSQLVGWEVERISDGVYRLETPSKTSFYLFFSSSGPRWSLTRSLHITNSFHQEISTAEDLIRYLKTDKFKLELLRSGLEYFGIFHAILTLGEMESWSIDHIFRSAITNYQAKDMPEQVAKRVLLEDKSLKEEEIEFLYKAIRAGWPPWSNWDRDPMKNKWFSFLLVNNPHN